MEGSIGCRSLDTLGGSMKIRYRVELSSRVPVRCESILAARAFVFALLLCLGSLHGWAQQTDPQPLRGLDDQVQEITSDVLSIAQELNRLVAQLIYSSGTQAASCDTLAKVQLTRFTS